jgi:hypothetical protein
MTFSPEKYRLDPGYNIIRPAPPTIIRDAAAATAPAKLSNWRASIGEGAKTNAHLGTFACACEAML